MQSMSPLRRTFQSLLPTLFLSCVFLLPVLGSELLAKAPRPYTVAFYNVENLFDTIDDPAINDADFLPNGKYKWNSERLTIKLQNMAKVISRLGDADGPEILGLSEVENRSVLEMLAANPLIRSGKYAMAHIDSPDERGIDVALFFKKKAFTLTTMKAYPVKLEGQDHTRDILLVKGNVMGKYPLHLMVNHWPSRRGGAAKSEPARFAAARVVRAVTDSIRKADPTAAIVIMGDLNDDPDSPSLLKELRAATDLKGSAESFLWNATAALHHRDSYGSLMYDGKWNLFDQIILSHPLAAGQNKLRYVQGSAMVYKPEFLTQKEGEDKGSPLRTFEGNRFQNPGYSDHFPTCIQLSFAK